MFQLPSGWAAFHTSSPEKQQKFRDDFAKKAGLKEKTSSIPLGLSAAFIEAYRENFPNDFFDSDLSEHPEDLFTLVE